MRLIAADGQRKWLKLSDYTTRLTRDDWQQIVWITCHDLDAPRSSLRYRGSTQLELTHQELVDTLAVRWQVETFFAYDKDLLGSDHYQVLSAQAILRSLPNRGNIRSPSA